MAPGAHSHGELRPSKGATLFGGQGWHPSPHVLAGHGKQRALPSRLDHPDGQASQANALPTVSLKVPAGHGAQSAVVSF